jgi:hypothetical protein
MELSSTKSEDVKKFPSNTHNIYDPQLSFNFQIKQTYTLNTMAMAKEIERHNFPNRVKEQRRSSLAFTDFRQQGSTAVFLRSLGGF